VTHATGKTPPYLVMTQGRERLLGELRRRGARGGIIGPHRAMAKGRLTPWRLTSMAVIPVLLSIATVVLLSPLSRLWASFLDAAHRPLGLPGSVASDVIFLPGGLQIAVPYLTTHARLPAGVDFWIVGALCAAAIVISLFLPQRLLPLTYFLRFAVLIQLTAFLNFLLRPDAFPYDLPRYLLSLFQIGSAVLVLIPIVLGFTLFPFDIALWRKIAVAALCVGHLAILIPLQVLIHAFLIQHLSLLVMPMLFFLWGILPQLFAFIALYAWAMSWPDVPARWPAPARRA
jgi:hypothetical protein